MEPSRPLAKTTFLMKRREALSLTATILGGTLIGADAFLSGCKADSKNTGLFSENDIRLLDEIGETILPETDQSPGAKAAQIGEFMQTIVTDCYDEKEQVIFIAGLGTVEKTAKEKFSNSFLKITSGQRLEMLTVFDNEAKNVKEGEPAHFFGMMKELTLWGYFSSEPGVTQALRYNPVPGRFEGCVPYGEGERAWY